MLLIRGSPGEAELYFRRGWELSKSISSTAFCEKFSLSLAETDYRRLRLDESEKRFQELATSEDLSDESTKDLASRHMRAGDLCFRRGDFEAAEARYEKARIILDMLASPTFLAALEKGEPVIAAMPIESAPSSGDRLPADRAKTVPDNKNAKGDTFLLSYVKTELLARLGSTIIRQGRLPEAEKRMTAGSLDESALDQVSTSTHQHIPFS